MKDEAFKEIQVKLVQALEDEKTLFQEEHHLAFAKLEFKYEQLQDQHKELEQVSQGQALVKEDLERHVQQLENELKATKAEVLQLLEQKQQQQQPVSGEGEDILAERAKAAEEKALLKAEIAALQEQVQQLQSSATLSQQDEQREALTAAAAAAAAQAATDKDAEWQAKWEAETQLHMEETQALRSELEKSKEQCHQLQQAVSVLSSSVKAEHEVEQKTATAASATVESGGEEKEKEKDEHHGGMAAPVADDSTDVAMLRTEYDRLVERAAQWQEDCLAAQEAMMLTEGKLQRAQIELLAARSALQELEDGSPRMSPQQQQQQQEQQEHQQQQLKALEEANAQLESRMTALLAKQGHLEAEREQIYSQLDQWMKRQQEQGTEAGAELSGKGLDDAHLGELLEAVVAAVQRQQGLLEEKIQRLEEEKAKEEEEAARRSKEHGPSDAQAIQLQQQQHQQLQLQLQHRVSEYEMRVAELAQTIVELRGQLDQSREALAQEQAVGQETLEGLEQALATARMATLDKERQLEQVSLDLDDARSRVGQLESELQAMDLQQSMQQQQQQDQAAVAAAQGRIQGLEQELREVQQKHEALTAAYATKERDLSSQLKSVEDQCRFLEQALENARRAETHASEARQQVSTDQQQQQQERLEALEAENKKLASHVQTMEGRLAAIDSVKQRLEADLTLMQEQNLELVADIEQLRQAKKQLEYEEEKHKQHSAVAAVRQPGDASELSVEQQVANATGALTAKLLQAEHDRARLQQFLQEFQDEKKMAIDELSERVEQVEAEKENMRAQLAKAEALLWNSQQQQQQQQPHQPMVPAQDQVLAQSSLTTPSPSQATEKIHQEALLALEPLQRQKSELERTLQDLKHRYELSQRENDRLLSQLEQENQTLRTQVEKLNQISPKMIFAANNIGGAGMGNGGSGIVSARSSFSSVRDVRLMRQVEPAAALLQPNAPQQQQQQATDEEEVSVTEGGDEDDEAVEAGVALLREKDEQIETLTRQLKTSQREHEFTRQDMRMLKVELARLRAATKK
ncbi:hypothetical protein BGZ73_009076 [Actinomortierella ambigua]|nr:hypothetical protein BGZ73_009076 [Actinomortierella ambigua]